MDGLTIENVVIDALFAIENNGVGRIENTRVTGTTAMVRYAHLRWRLYCDIGSSNQTAHSPSIFYIDGRFERRGDGRHWRNECDG